MFVDGKGLSFFNVGVANELKCCGFMAHVVLFCVA